MDELAVGLALFDRMDHVVLADGRRLDFRLTGPPDGQVMVFHVGTPMGGTRFRFLESAAEERGLRVLVMSRPGYGHSTPLPGRSVIHVVDDTRQVLDQLGIDEVLLAGFSGGGSHALACAARMRGAKAVLSIAGTAPKVDDLDWTAGMGEENINGFLAAMEGEEALRPMIEENPYAIHDMTVEQMVENMDSLLPDVDKEFLTTEVGADFLASIQEAYRTGVEGSLDDSLSFVRPWGIDLAEIEVPAIIWHGSEDLMAPFAHGQWLARNVPTAVAHLESGEGHVSILVGMIGLMLDELIAAAA